MPVQFPRKEDGLPKVVVCGVTENNIPRLLLCDYGKQREKEACVGECNDNRRLKSKNTEDEETMGPNYQTGGGCYPPQMPCQQNDMQQMQWDLMQRNQAIDNLQRQVCGLQCQMQMLMQQNGMLSQKLQAACAGGAQGPNVAEWDETLTKFLERNDTMEKQIGDLVNSIKSMRCTMGDIKKKNGKEKNRPEVCIPFPPTCGFYPPCSPC